MKNFLIGCLSGALFVLIIDKVFLGGEMTVYEFIIGIIDKPLVQTHGICILAGLALYFLTYRMADSLTQKFYQQSQEMIQENTKILGKIIKSNK